MKANSGPTVGLALSGGTAKSIAHVGVLQGLTEADIPIDYIAGTSGGAIVGAIYAAGFSVEDLTRIAATLRWKDLARITFPRLGLLNNSGIASFITDLLGDITFDDLKIPLAVTGTELLSGQKVIFREGKVAQAVMISSSLPNVFEPVEVDGNLYSDGGLTEYLPIQTVKTFHPDVTIGVNLGKREGRANRPRHLLHVAMLVTGIAAQQNARFSEPLADVVIRPPTASFPSFDLSASSQLIEVGYNATKACIPEIRAAMAEAAPHWTDRLKFWEHR